MQPNQAAKKSKKDKKDKRSSSPPPVTIAVYPPLREQSDTEENSKLPAYPEDSEADEKEEDEEGEIPEPHGSRDQRQARPVEPSDHRQESNVALLLNALLDQTRRIHCY